MLRLTAAALLAASPAAANPEGVYLKAFAGLSSLQDTDFTIGGAVNPDIGFDSGTLAGGAIGYGYGASPWAVELEFAYRSGEARSGAAVAGDFASTSLMVNGVYSFDNRGRLSPYAGAGLGYVTEVDFDVSGTDEYSDRGGVAWQLFSGVSYAVTDSVGVFGELRYFDAGSRSLDGPGGALDADYSTLDVIAGVSFSF